LAAGGGVVNQRFAVIFGGSLAFMLLMLYAGTVVYMIFDVVRAGRTDPAKALQFSGGLVFVVTTIGGLVSALVIAKLAITEPGKSPSIRHITATPDQPQSRSDTGLAMAYLAVWLIVGLGALIVGVTVYPEVNQTLRDIGTSWLGLAVASGYAYFGIAPKT
jgi:hypothetical protein